MNELVKLYVCPNCSQTAEEGTTVPLGVVQGIKPLVGNVLVDTLVCPVCGCTWRAYIQVADANIEVVSVPQNGDTEGEPDVDATEETTDNA